MRHMLGVDVGGTFTDVTLVEVKTKWVVTHKVRSTPSDPSKAIMTGIREILAREGVMHKDVDYLAHGTTVSTNALIEKTGSLTGLLTTQGFRDLLEIGDQTRPSLYDLQVGKPQPIIPTELRVEVPERLFQDGSVRLPLDETALRSGLQQLAEQGIQSLAICFLFSFENPEHERRAAEIAREVLPHAFISTSSSVVPEFREFPRLSTTALNAYLGPVMKTYLSNLENSVREAGILVAPYITQSNGGNLSVQETIATPIRTAISGPSAGVVAAAHLGAIIGEKNLITLDMGGTSADISLIENETPLVSMEREVGGWPVRIPMLDIVTIGAGGGSIAWVDAGNALKVGPRSAGAVPGPACYGQGGTEPTVTDANILLGRVNPKGILGGKMVLYVNAAEGAITKRVSSRINLSATEAANGILDVVNATMVRAIRGVSVEHGHNPRDFTLVAFGGAGPLHAVALAQELGIPRVIVPPAAGTFCSFGLMVADIRSDHVRSQLVRPKVEAQGLIRRLFFELITDGQDLLDKEGVAREYQEFDLWAEVRYRRQNYELPVRVTRDELDDKLLKLLTTRFHDEHERLYGYARHGAEIELVNFRATAIGKLPKAELARLGPRDSGHVRAIYTRRVYFRECGGFVNCPVYNRPDLRAMDRLVGPAVIEQLDATTLLPPGYTCEIDELGILHIAANG